MKTPDLPEEKPSAPNKRHFNPIADLFPESLPPVVAALWPTRGTRADETLQALLIAPQNQADYWIGWRLAAYVQSLEDDGWALIKRDIIKPGCRRAITEYAIDRTDPSTAAALASRQNGNMKTPDLPEEKPNAPSKRDPGTAATQAARGYKVPQ